MDGITLPWLAERNAHKFPDEEAVVVQGPDGRRETVTHAEFHDRAHAVARALRTRGVGEADTVGVYMANNVETLETYLGATILGAMPVPVNHRFKAEEVGYVLEDSGADVLVFDAAAADVVGEVHADSGTPADYLYVGPEPPAYADSYAVVRDEAGGDPLDVVPTRLDPAMLMYTSGTTGRPKGCVLTHDNLVQQATNSAVEAAVEDRGTRMDGRSLVVTPLFHIAAFGLFLNAFYVSATTVLLADFDPERVMEVLEAESVTSAFFVPTMARALLALPDFEQYDLSAFEDFGIGAAPSGRELKATIQERFGADVSDAFGQTELAPTTTTLHPGDALEKPDSVGRPLLNVMVKVLDPETGDPVEPGEIGRICYKGPTTMAGYYGMPDRTDEVIDADGWFHSGDLVRRDADGFVTFVGRSDDMIVTGGENVYPAEIEEVLHEYEAVDEAAVVGVPDDTWGERVKAAVVLEAGADLDAAALRASVESRLADFKQPREIVFVDDLPRNPTGKVLKSDVETL